MTLMKSMRTAIAALGTLAIATQTNAADIYSPGGYKDSPSLIASPIWTGFYIGGHMGGAWSSIGTNSSTFWDGTSANPWHYTNFGGEKLTSTDVFGGAQFGYNWQSTNFVYGVEIDLGGLAGDNQRTFTATTLHRAGDIDKVAAVNVKEDGGFYGDVAGRLGYAWGNVLLYAKGGFAWLDPNFKVSGTITDHRAGTITGFTNSDDNKTLTGWTAGGGLELMLNPHWTMKVEYLYFNFGSDDRTFTIDANNSWKTLKGDLTVNTVKLGFNYLLSSTYVPLK
jgi:outer membrane immunogenic protein